VDIEGSDEGEEEKEHEEEGSPGREGEEAMEQGGGMVLGPDRASDMR